MSIQELGRPRRKEPVQIPPEQEAKIGLVSLTRQMLDLERPDAKTPGVRKSTLLLGSRALEFYDTPHLGVTFEREVDERTDEEKVTQPFTPVTETHCF